MNAPATDRNSSASRKILAILPLVAMCAAVLFTFRSPDLFNGNWRINGIDFAHLHRWRIEYAQQAISENGAIPSWYSREFLGSPFWSNLQNFPLIPTRLFLLWMNSRDIYTVEVYILALLAGIFTYLFARAIGLNIVSSALSGFTFACSGFFASRLMLGHIGILEVFPSLPALLWIVHRLCVPSSDDSKSAYVPSAKWYLALAVACVCFALAAHPQIFIYSAAASGAYLIWRCRNRQTFLRAVATMALALGAAAIVLYPMSQLVSRSSRMLELDPATNDLPLRFDRLPALFFPWYNGAPAPVKAPPGTGALPASWVTSAMFWESVDYVGKIPIISALVLVLAGIIRFLIPSKEVDSPALFRASSDAIFLSVLGAASVLLAIPILALITGKDPNAAGAGMMLLRSPARVLYLFVFALSIAIGAIVHQLWLFARAHSQTVRIVTIIAVIAIVAAHFFDLYQHDRCFVETEYVTGVSQAGFVEQVRKVAGDGRIGMDKALNIDINRTIDDVGVFDSILLIGSYQTMLDLNELPPRLNIQEIDGGQMTARALRACGARLVVTRNPRDGETPIAQAPNLNVYAFPGASPRVLFYPAASAHYYTAEETRNVIRTNALDVAQNLLVPPQARESLDANSPPGDSAARPSREQYSRPTSDRIEVHLNHPTCGFVRLLEAFDAGWSATIDGKPAPIFRAHNMVMAIPIPAGEHQLVVEYFTPGKNLGLVLSLISVGLLVVLIRNAQGAELRARKSSRKRREAEIISARADRPPAE